jgi:hypothetical protein
VQELVLHSNELRQVSVSAGNLPWLGRLTKLDLSNNWTTAVPPALAAATSLRWLRMRNRAGRMCDAGMCQLPGMIVKAICLPAQGATCYVCRKQFNASSLAVLHGITSLALLDMGLTHGAIFQPETASSQQLLAAFADLEQHNPNLEVLSITTLAIARLAWWRRPEHVVPTGVANMP